MQYNIITDVIRFRMNSNVLYIQLFDIELNPLEFMSQYSTDAH